MEQFKKNELSNVAIAKIIGGNQNEDVPVTTLGTITNDGDG